MPTEFATSPKLALRHGSIHTVDVRRPRAEALLVRGGRIAAIGSNDEIEALASQSAISIDLEGRMVMPGLINVHSHFIWARRSGLYETHSPSTHSIDEILDLVRKSADGRHGPDLEITI